MKAEDCVGLTSRRAGRYLRELAKQVPADQCIVEIGVYTGRSLLYLAEGSTKGNLVNVYGVDPWNLPRPSKPKYSSSKTYEYAMNAIAMSEAAEVVSIIPIRDYGVNVAENWDGPKVGLIYIDADHRYTPVLEDYYSWKPHLAENALVCFDDYDLATFPGVVQAVDELVALGEITDLKVVADRMAVSMFIGGDDE